ncbi:MAG: hypothetical protein M1482_04860 [Chloroflexi bacterium]|nr:hypothetical protein [Chloroflexota bacterium]
MIVGKPDPYKPPPFAEAVLFDKMMWSAFNVAALASSEMPPPYWAEFPPGDPPIVVFVMVIGPKWS